MSTGPQDDDLEALASGALSLDQLMAQSGVKRMGGVAKSKPRPKKAPKAPKARARTAARPVAPSPSAPVERPVDPQVAELRGRIQVADARVATLEAELAAVRAELAEASASLADKGDAMALLEARVADRDVTTLTALLEARGLRGDQRGVALRALIDAHRWEELVGLLDVLDVQRARRVLDHHLALHCGAEDCPVPDHLAALPVPRDRCELCAGLGRTGVLRAISDELLLSGVTRVALLRGPTSHLRLLTGQLDPRIEARRVRSADEVGDAQLVLAWGDAPPDALAVAGGVADVLETLRAWNRR